MPTKIFRYNISGFVEELPPLPEQTHGHTCAVLPSTGVRLDLDQPLEQFQAFVVAGGQDDGSTFLYSVVTLLPGATTWTQLADLPRALTYARASVVGGRLRVNGGYDGGSGDLEIWRSEVMIANHYEL